LQGSRARGAGQERLHARQAAHRCEACGLNVTNTPPRGLPLRVKVEAVPLHVSGSSMNRTAKLLGVSTPSVQAWIERFAEAYAQGPEGSGLC
jgi:transposase